MTGKSGSGGGQFKIDFTSAHLEFCLTNLTARQSGFHSASMMIEKRCRETMQDTDNVITQLATATASDRGTVATLTATNVKLAVQLGTSQANIKKLKEEISDLKAKIKPACQGQRSSKSTRNDNY
jgi:predicted RNase H-like nuclease (RuvC/YqgF family)